MAELHDLRRARKRQPFPIPSSACVVLAAFDINKPAQIGRVRFRLKARRRGTEIFFIYADGPSKGFSWNVSLLQDIWPKTFTEARRWVHAYAARYGHVVEEIVKARPPRAKGDDRKLLKSGGCKEAWLRSDVPQLWAEAMVRCRHSGAHCGQDGFCHFGGCEMEMDPKEPDSAPVYDRGMC